MGGMIGSRLPVEGRADGALGRLTDALMKTRSIEKL